jgi:hypothetical protein
MNTPLTQAVLNTDRVLLAAAIEAGGKTAQVLGLDKKLRELPGGIAQVVVHAEQMQAARKHVPSWVEVIGALSLDDALAQLLDAQVKLGLDLDLRGILAPLEQKHRLAAKRGAVFVGREWLFEKLSHWLEVPNAMGSAKGHGLVLVADPGFGKSAWVAELVRRNPGGAVLGCHLCEFDDPVTHNPMTLLACLLCKLVAAFPAVRAGLDVEALRRAWEDPRSDPLALLDRWVVNRLPREGLAPGQVCVFLVDGLDETPATDTRLVEFVVKMEKRLPPWFRLIATCRRDQRVLERMGAWAEWRFTPDHNRDDAREYVDYRLDRDVQLRRNLFLQVVSATEAARRLLAKAENNFYYLTFALDALAEPDGPFTFALLDSLPTGLASLYLGFFRTTFPTEEKRGRIRPLLSILLSAEGPLPSNLLYSALGPDAPDLLKAVGGLVKEFEDSAGGLAYGLCHATIAEWLAEVPDLDSIARHEFRVRARDGHARLAETGLVHWRNGDIRESPYLLRVLPRHLLGAGRADDGLRILTDMSYLKAAVEFGRGRGLAESFAAASQSEQIPPVWRQGCLLMGRAWLRCASFVVRHPETLFQELFNLLAGAEPPDKREGA